MNQIKVDNKFLKFRLTSKLIGFFLLSMIIAFSIERVGWSFQSIDGVPVAFSFLLFVSCTVSLMIIFGLFILYDYFWQKRLIFSINGEEIQMKGGILKSFDRITDISHVTDVTVYQGMWAKIFNYASIGFKKEGPAHFEEVVFTNISMEDANRVRKIIHEHLGWK